MSNFLNSSLEKNGREIVKELTPGVEDLSKDEKFLLKALNKTKSTSKQPDKANRQENLPEHFKNNGTIILSSWGN